MTEKNARWDWEINRHTSWLGGSMRELLQYKDLLLRLVRKDFLASYQQTLLGPFWVVVQPLLMVFTYMLVFNRVIGISTGNIPPFLFYLTGITLWSLFSDIFSGASATFVQNAAVFSKVYFPRLVVPGATVLLHTLRFGVQLFFLAIALVYFYAVGQWNGALPNPLLMLPPIFFTIAIALGSGLLFSVLTAKYRDLQNIMNLIIRLLMFVCPIFYTLSTAKPQTKWLLYLNPLSAQFELFRKAILGYGEFHSGYYLYSVAAAIVLVSIGVLFFNKSGDQLIDVI